MSLWGSIFRIRALPYELCPDAWCLLYYVLMITDRVIWWNVGHAMEFHGRDVTWIETENISSVWCNEELINVYPWDLEQKSSQAWTHDLLHPKRERCPMLQRHPLWNTVVVEVWFIRCRQALEYIMISSNPPVPLRSAHTNATAYWWRSLSWRHVCVYISTSHVNTQLDPFAS